MWSRPTTTTTAISTPLSCAVPGSRGGGRHPNSLLNNDGEGRFTDVTFASGLGDVHYPTQTAAWADYDNDGDVDLYIGNEHGEQHFDGPCQLFKNNGDGTFTDVAATAGVDHRGFVKGVVWGDTNGDRFPDLYVSTMQGENLLYLNNRDGTFTDGGCRTRGRGADRQFPGWFWDYDNDGQLDLYVPSYKGETDALAAVAASYLESRFVRDAAPLSRHRRRLFRERCSTGWARSLLAADGFQLR